MSEGRPEMEAGRGRGKEEVERSTAEEEWGNMNKYVFLAKLDTEKRDNHPTIGPALIGVEPILVKPPLYRCKVMTKPSYQTRMEASADGCVTCINMRLLEGRPALGPSTTGAYGRNLVRRATQSYSVQERQITPSERQEGQTAAPAKPVRPSVPSGPVTAAAAVKGTARSTVAGAPDAGDSPVVPSALAGTGAIEMVRLTGGGYG